MGMTYTTAARNLLPVILGLVALSFVGLGLFGLLRKRPFVMSARWTFALIVVCFSPSLVMQIALYLDGRDRLYAGSLRWVSLLVPLMFAVVIAFMAIATRGYLVFSATQSSLRDGLLAALERMELPFDETLATIRLPTVPAELYVAVQGWIGTAQIRLRKGKGGDLLRRIAGSLNEEFRLVPVSTNHTWAVVYVILGVLTGVTVIVTRTP